MNDAIKIVVSMVNTKGNRKLENTFNDKLLFNVEEKWDVSKWITLNAFPVLKKYGEQEKRKNRVRSQEGARGKIKIIKLINIKPMKEQNIEDIIKKYSPIVRSIYFRMTRDSDFSEEDYQETWIEVFKRINFLHNQSQLFLYTKITFRTILRKVKKEKTYSIRFMGAVINPKRKAKKTGEKCHHKLTRSTLLTVASR